MEQLICSEEKNKKLIKKNKELVKINQQLNIQVKELQTSTSTQNAIIQEMKKDTEKEEASVINALRKICTPVCKGFPERSRDVD